MPIGYANICLSMHDHRQNFSVFNSSIGCEEQMRALGFTKWKLEACEEKRL